MAQIIWNRLETPEQYNARMEKEYWDELIEKGPILVFAGNHGEFVQWAESQGYNPLSTAEIVFVQDFASMLGRKAYRDRVIWVGSAGKRHDVRQLRQTLIDQILKTERDERIRRFEF